MSATIGIDFGTVGSVVAHISTDDAPEVINNAEGMPITPSAVLYREDGTVLVGEQAEDNATMHPDRYVGELKRHLGEDVTFEIGEQEKSPEELAAEVIRKLVRDASNRLGTEVESAVIAVPASFTHRQRRAMTRAGELAGVEVEALLPEPNAAVLAYGVQRQKLGTEGEETVFVYDLGRDTFSISLVRIKHDYGYAETVATEGRLDLGGSDWTTELADVLFERIEAETGINLRTGEKWTGARQRVQKAADDAKRRLSERLSTAVTIPYVVPEQSYNLDTTVTREAFEEATVDPLDATRERIDRLFLDSGVPVDDVDTVLPIGGSSRMPQIDDLMTAYFGLSPIRAIDPEYAVAFGAAIHSSLVADDANGVTLADDDHGEAGMVLIDTVPSTISLVARGEDGTRTVVPLVEKDTQTPTRSRVDGLAVQEGRTVISAPVVQGTPPDANRNEVLGMLRVEEVPRNRRSEIRIEVGVSDDGSLQVWGTNLADNTALSTKIISVHDVGDIDRVHESLPQTL
jgi:molecular chaperone DnaK